MLESKIKTLLKAYKSAKDHNKQTGVSPCIVPFEDILDDLFGDRPMMGRSNTINVSSRSSATPLSPKRKCPPSFYENSAEKSLAISSSAPIADTAITMSSVSVAGPSTVPDRNFVVASPGSTAAMSSSVPKPSLKESLLRRRKSTKELLKEKEISCRKEIAVEKEKAKLERLKLKFEFLSKIEDRRDERTKQILDQKRELFHIELADRNRRQQEQFSQK